MPGSEQETRTNGHGDRQAAQAALARPLQPEPPPRPPRRPFGARALAIVAQRCPRCLHGAVFKDLLAAHEHCPVCGLKYEREPGYFTGGMVFSYTLGVFLLTALVILLFLLEPAWSIELVLGVAVVPFLLLVPVIYRYSRVLWLHLDWYLEKLA